MQCRFLTVGQNGSYQNAGTTVHTQTVMVIYNICRINEAQIILNLLQSL